ncbi:MAG: restriction endonuclease subunit S [Methanoculleus sp.]|nr:restriction endonuclease subunit S [Candidatus Methanomethylophilaceae archaeon]MDD3932705.1 restriction endonuclease subunit S [Methanoculleus sp.]MDD4454558.1 restriction endonuclease subunit S [Candidatus Methanomethylophilaceae archaeon]
MIGWPIVTLGDVFEIARGGSPRPIEDFITDDPGGINWIMISDASEGSKYITSTRRRIRPEGAQRSRKVKPGDFLLTNSMSFGRPYIMRTSGCIHDGWLVLSPRTGNVNADFFYHLLGSKRIYAEFKRRAAGVTVKNLNIDLVRGVKISLPPLSEQRRIAEILDKADALRAKRRAVLARLDTLAQSIFLDMFGDPATNPKGWARRTLGELTSEFRYGSSNKSASQGKPALRIPNVVGGAVDPTELKLVPVDEAEFERLRLRDGDLLLVRTNGNPDFVGRCAVFDSRAVSSTGFAGDDFIFASYLIRARLNANLIEPIFLKEYLLGAEGCRQLRSRSKTSAGQYNINTESLRTVPVLVPPLSLQREFVRWIVHLEKLKLMHLTSLAQLDAVFTTLQHHAFQGDL